MKNKSAILILLFSVYGFLFQAQAVESPSSRLLAVPKIAPPRLEFPLDGYMDGFRIFGFNTGMDAVVEEIESYHSELNQPHEMNGCRAV